MSGWLREYGRELRWTLVVLVLAAAGAVALWPRTAEQPDEEAGAPSPPPPPPTAERVEPAQRQAADLQSCPSGGSGPAELTGARGTCLADGSSADLGAAVADGPVLVNVWATWCAPCLTELPALQAYADRPDSARVLGVQVMSGEAGGLDMLRELGVHFPSLHDTDNSLREALRVPNLLPASYLVTERGEVRRMPPAAFESPDEVAEAVRRTSGDGR